MGIHNDRTYRAAVNKRWARYLARLLSNPVLEMNGQTRAALLSRGYVARMAGGRLRVTVAGRGLIEAVRL